MKVQVLDAPFDPWRIVAEHERGLTPGRRGAAAVFVGTMRDANAGAPVAAMTLEHYAPMTERHLARIAAEAQQRWALEDVVIVHRVGRLAPNDPIVLVAAWSAHREAAFAACRYVIDELKTRAPFWKREETDAGARWVEGKNSEK